MGKRSRCVIDICDNEKKRSNMDGDIITIHGAVKAA